MPPRGRAGQLPSALLLSNLDDLPISVRRTAAAAARGDLDSLSRLCSLSKVTDDLPYQKTLFLPALYPNIDLAGIPSVGEFDIALPAPMVRSTVIRALMALEALIEIKISGHDLFMELWPRYWGWAQFFYTYYEHLLWFPEKPGPTDTGISTNMPVFREAFSETPGFRAMVVTAWRSTLRDDVEYCWITGCILEHLTACGVWGSPDLEEVIDGAGGLNDFAALLVGHIARMLRETEVASCNEFESYLYGVLALISEVEERANPQHDTGPTVLAPLTIALLHCGIVPVAASLLCALGRFRSLITMDRCILILGRILGSVAGYQQMPVALEAGLLSAIILCSELNHKEINTQLTMLLTQFLPSSLVYYNVVSKMKPALREAEDYEDSITFRESEVFEAWVELKSLASERMKTLDRFRSDEYISCKACDNLNCTVTRERTTFRRCGVCKCSYYCSKECQTEDWGIGGHRITCSERPGLHSPNSLLSFRERGFLCALMDNDYQARSIRMQEVQFMNKHPNTPFYTLFNYTRGIDVSVYAADNDDWPTSELAGMQWDREITRMMNSCGRSRLHVVLMSVGDGVRFWVVPLRSDSATTYDGMVQLATSLPSAEHFVEFLGSMLTGLTQLEGSKRAVEFH
ncbi:hypothetical protein C8R43DRAFT_1042086 [Mycena crocata]|nr:hypothetical protein C8R43DRAFT_1042086 [Mycena crocata]